MKKELLSVLETNFSANILKHKMNVEIMLNNPMAIHDHTDWMAAIEKEIAHIAEYEDKLEVVLKHFVK
jgi:TusA-related sulfurtransferase